VICGDFIFTQVEIMCADAGHGGASRKRQSVIERPEKVQNDAGLL
jgi:hypothetical protein